MIRSGDLKLMVAQSKESQSVDALYDLKADPLEMRNLIASPISREHNREQAEMMKARLVRWIKQHEPQKADELEQREMF
jgi:hypothetical protein